MDFITSDLVIGFTAIIYLIALINILRIVRQDLSPGAALSWILINAAFPLLGVPLYYFLGQSKITGYVKQRNLIPKSTEKHAGGISKGPRLPSYAMTMVASLSKLDELYQAFPGEADLMIDGKEAFPEIFKAIGEAKEYILVQYYILKQDRLGLELKGLLESKAARGIKVYLLIDDWGSFGLGRRYVRDLKKAGVKVVRFLPVGLRFSFQVNFRNHRKLVLIDGKVAFTGGLNMGVEYLGNKKAGHWRDTHLKLTGPCLGPLITTFIEDWNFASKKDLSSVISFPEVSINPEKAKWIQTISFGPGDDLPSGGLTLFTQAIHSAKESLWIATPYLIPDSILENALIMAALRGVKIRILIPQKADSKLVHMVSLVHGERLKKYAEIFLYTNGFMHQKVILIDKSSSIIGTSNFDNRSIYLNFETSLVIHNQKFASKVAAMLEKDFSNAVPMSQKRPLRGFTKKFSRFIRLLGPLF